MNEQKLILIADDAVFMRRMLRRTLTEGGYTNFIEAVNGADAVALYTEHQPDLVFLDVTMPEKNGLEALVEIMQINPNAKVVMCSAIGQNQTIMDAIRSGASDFIVKPFNRDRVLEVASSLIY